MSAVQLAASPFGAPPVVVKKGTEQGPLVVGGMQVQGPFEPVKDRWSSGICDCFQDCATCLAACCCPFIAIGQLYERVLKVVHPSCTLTSLAALQHAPMLIYAYAARPTARRTLI